MSVEWKKGKLRAITRSRGRNKKDGMTCRATDDVILAQNRIFGNERRWDVRIEFGRNERILIEHALEDSYDRIIVKLADINRIKVGV